MKKKVILILAAALFLLPQYSHARRFSLSTNVVDYLNLCTLNLEASCGLNRHWTLNAGVRYNPFTYPRPGDDSQMQNRRQSYELGVRAWPWHVFSGWWIAARCQYSDFSDTGIWRYALNEGKALGASLSFGYTLMLSKHFNMEFGAGVWGGRLLEHNLYHCPQCMRIRESGPKAFIAPDNISVSVMYLF